MDIVEVKKGEIWADSNLVARKMGLVHGVFARSIKQVLNDFPDIKAISESPLTSEKYYIEARHYRGTDFDVYMMNREFFSLVAMRLTSKKARQWQRKFNDAFYAMERRLLQVETNVSDIEWNSSRLIGKTARAEEVDAIQQFVEYATEQGSKNAKHYYSNITKASYKALGLMASKHPKLRDEMNIYELSELMLAERLAASKIKKYMALGRDYKDIYACVRDDLIAYADAIRMPSNMIG